MALGTQGFLCCVTKPRPILKNKYLHISGVLDMKSFQDHQATKHEDRVLSLEGLGRHL